MTHSRAAASLALALFGAICAPVPAANATIRTVCPEGTVGQFICADLDYTCSALAVLPEGVVAGGQFTAAGGKASDGSALWTGSEWRTMPSGLIEDFDFFQGKLIGVGTPANRPVASWDGTQWKPIGQFPVPLIGETLATSLERLFVAGRPIAKGFATYFVYIWDGQSWSHTAAVDTSSIQLAVYHGSLHAAVRSPELDGALNPTVLRWEDDHWVDLHAPINEATDLYVHNDHLLVAHRQIGQADAIAVWDGSTWGTIPSRVTNAPIARMSVYNGELVVCGEFHSIEGVPARGVARLAPDGWHGFGDGVEGGAYCAVQQGSDLFAGGRMYAANGRRLGNIARWNGNQWLPLQTAGMGINGTVYESGDVFGELALMGWFAAAGSVLTGNSPRSFGAAILRDGEWAAFELPPNDRILALRTINGSVVAAVDPERGANPLDVPVIARRAADGSWVHLTGLTGFARDVIDHEKQIVAVGTLYLGHESVSAAVWHDDAWLPLGTPQPEWVDAVFNLHGALHLIGTFREVNGDTTTALAQLVNDQWQILVADVPRATLTSPVIGSTFYFSDRNQIYSWNGTELATVESPSIDPVYYTALGMHQGGLTVAAERIYRDGRYTSIAWRDGPTWKAATNGQMFQDIFVLGSTVQNGESRILAAGSFTTMGGLPTGRVATHNFAQCDSFCIGDTNRDGIINGSELSVVLSEFGKTYPQPYDGADYSGDARVDIRDLNFVLARFGLPCI